MAQEFPPPARSIRLIPVADLHEIEKVELANIGFDLASVDKVVSDIRDRMERDNVDANTANRMAIDEYEQDDRLSTVNPDIAADLRSAMLDSVMGGASEVAKALDMADEDAQDLAQNQEPSVTKPTDTQSPTQTTGSVEENPIAKQIREAAIRQDQRRTLIKASITDDERNQVLEEAMIGTPYSRSFDCWDGRLSITVQTIPTSLRMAIQDLMAEKVNSSGSLTIGEYNNYRKVVDTACSLKMVTIGDKIAYMRNPSVTDPQKLVDAVFINGPARSEIVRSLISSAFDELANRLAIILEEATKDVFIDPVLAVDG